MKVKTAIKSMRLRTLPLSLAGGLLGICLAAADYHISYLTALFILLTASALQVLSNLSNELGDSLKGTDSAAERQGVHYPMMEGEVSVKQMKMLINGTTAITAASGAVMIWFSFGSFFNRSALAFLMLGLFAIWAAKSYTLGKNPYGYRGLGDIYVFIFFGLASVLGSYYICAHEFPSSILLLPAMSIGCFSVGVLNVNNIRDMKTDAATRVTVAMKMGEQGSRIYQTVLILLGWGFMFAFCFLRIFDLWHFLFVLSAPLFVKHLIGVWRLKDRELDKMLPLLVISTFLFSLLSGIGFLIFLI